MAARCPVSGCWPSCSSSSVACCYCSVAVSMIRRHRLSGCRCWLFVYISINPPQPLLRRCPRALPVTRWSKRRAKATNDIRSVQQPASIHRRSLFGSRAELEEWPSKKKTHAEQTLMLLAEMLLIGSCWRSSVTRTAGRCLSTSCIQPSITTSPTTPPSTSSSSSSRCSLLPYRQT